MENHFYPRGNVCVCVCFAVKFNLEGIGYDLEGVHFDRFEGK